MSALAQQSQSRVVEYDAIKRRLWILGQRCHHGATGSIVAMLACTGLMVESAKLDRVTAPTPIVALALTGTALMAHDWKDRSIWFERGYGTQP